MMINVAIDGPAGGYSYSYMAAASGRTEKAVDNAIQRIRRKLSRIISSGDNSES